MNLPFVLDVAIGLTFTYLILSLLASEIQELIATVLQWRAKHLKDSIEILLAGGGNSPQQQQVKDLVDRLYSDPLLKNVNQEAKGVIPQAFRRITRILFSGNRKGAFGDHQDSGPSYIAPETFATSIVERLGITSMVGQLSSVRLEKFVHRIVGDYTVAASGAIQIPSDDLLSDDWQKGSVRVLAAKSNKLNLNQDPNFQLLVEDYSEALKAFQSKETSLDTSIERLGESLDTYINACPEAGASDLESTQYLRRLRSYKLSTFGQNNDRAVTSGGLKPSLSEIAELVNQGSTVHKEVAQAYDRIANQARPIDAQVNVSIQEQIDNYRVGLDPNAPDQPTKYEDLSFDLQQAFLGNALKDLSDSDRQLYEDYQAHKQIRDGLNRLPDSVKESLSILARRAQTRVQQADDEISQFRDEIALWFDRSMSRASGVYKRNAKGVAIIIGLLIAATTNSDTFHIFNRLSSDDDLRKIITDRATALNLNAANSPRLSTQLEELKNETDAVLRDIAFPISWTPSNLSNQLGCPTAPIAVQPASEAAQLQAQWDNLYKSCLTTNQSATVPLPIQVVQIVAHRPLGLLRMISGWAVSGIAIAMGAPFWFDLLGKIVNVRNAGGKPASTAGETQSTN